MLGGLVAAVAAAIAPACSLGAGTGSVYGTLNEPNCWVGGFDLHPDFFAAAPSAATNSLQIRIQHGGDNETFSDGLTILVDDVGEVRGDPASDGTPRPSLLGTSLVVAMPAGVITAGQPITPRSSQAIVHATVYLDATCRTLNDALFALDAVTVNADGSCLSAEGGAPPPAITCGGTSAPPPGA